jgi:hypothetical protein
LKLSGSGTEKVVLARGVLGEARVEANDTLDLVVGGNVKRKWLGSYKESKTFSTGRGSEGAGICGQGLSVDGLNERSEVERTGLSYCAWLGDVGNVCSGCCEKRSSLTSL